MELESIPPPRPCDGTGIEAPPVAVRPAMELLQMDDPDLNLRHRRCALNCILKLPFKKLRTPTTNF
ncbi:4-hydroxybenzoate octaprenyltransferase [Sesbania bispinosa]|nr:4-hydroxybenzoate octaprenyltransferase [Sesbania bispinosa]